MKTVVQATQIRSTSTISRGAWGVSLAALGLCLGLTACDDPMRPELPREAPAVVPKMPQPQTAIFGMAISDATRRIVPTLADEALTVELTTTLNDLSDALIQGHIELARGSITRSREAMKNFELNSPQTSSTSAELGAIRLALNGASTLLGVPLPATKK
jgi:hypothetical protein